MSEEEIPLSAAHGGEALGEQEKLYVRSNEGIRGIEKFRSTTEMVLEPYCTFTILI